VDASIVGVSELAKKFKGLDFALQKKYGPRMVAAAGTVVKRAAKAEAKSQGLRKSGALIANIAIKRQKPAPRNTIEYHVGVRHGNALGNGKKVVKYLALNKTGRVVTKRKDDPFYWRFLEFGTKHIRRREFMTKGFQKSQGQALAAMQSKLNELINKAAAP
jgi:HK97 gp10 family phage protein